MASRLTALLSVFLLGLLSCTVHASPAKTSPASTTTTSTANPYAPSYVHCPDNLGVTPASDGLSPEEQAWRNVRLTQVSKNLGSYLNNAKIPGFDVSKYLQTISAKNAPIAGMGISGGGSQSGMTGLGLWQALDARYPAAVKAGTGGLVQCLTYLTGLSGGGFNTVMPLAANNFSSLADLRADADLTSDYAAGPQNNPNTFIPELLGNVAAKQDAGFPVSATDLFGQFFRQFLNPDAAYGDVSDFADPGTVFSEGGGPMPIVLTTDVVPGKSPSIHKIPYPAYDQATVFEITPYYFGNWFGGRIQSFFPTKWLGTTMIRGRPGNIAQCASGFDKITFAQGTTGTAFNFWFIDLFYKIPLFNKRSITINVPPQYKHNDLVELVEYTAETANQTFFQSMWSTIPNPFLNLNKAMKDVKNLLLVDGSEAGETIPLRPLYIPERKVDFIIAYDASTEEPGNSWVNGTTFGQSATAAHNFNIPFPDVPDAATFVNLGLNRYPTFFGCNATSAAPLVLYVPNSPWSAYTNYSYMQSSFTNNQLDLVFENSLDMISYGQGKVSAGKNVPPFSSCIACGFILKSLGRTNQPIPSACQSCFKSHCWNGTVDDHPPNPSYNPGLLLDPGLSYKKWYNTIWNVKS